MGRAEAIQLESWKLPPEPVASVQDVPAGRGDPRIRQAFNDHFSFIWRYLRRLGLAASDADDAAQKVFMVFARRLSCVLEGKERAFLCGTAVRVASETRRKLERLREVPDGEFRMANSDAPAPSSRRPDIEIDRQRARALLDRVLAAMPLEQRSVFVLFELEELTTAHIAEILDLPVGTVASRLRRARQNFRAIVKRLQAGAASRGPTLQQALLQQDKLQGAAP